MKNEINNERVFVCSAVINKIESQSKAGAEQGVNFNFELNKNLSVMSS